MDFRHILTIDPCCWKNSAEIHVGAAFASKDGDFISQKGPPKHERTSASINNT